MTKEKSFVTKIPGTMRTDPVLVVLKCLYSLGYSPGSYRWPFGVLHGRRPGNFKYQRQKPGIQDWSLDDKKQMSKGVVFGVVFFVCHRENWRTILPHTMHQNVSWDVCSASEGKDEPCQKLQITISVAKIGKMRHRKHHLTTKWQPTEFSGSQQSPASFVKCHGKLYALVLSTESSLPSLKTCSENCLNNNPSLTDSCFGSLTQENFWFGSKKTESQNNFHESSTIKFKNLIDAPYTKYIQQTYTCTLYIFVYIHSHIVTCIFPG